MTSERIIMVSSDLLERAISLLDLLPESGTIRELRNVLVTQPAAGEPETCPTCGENEPFTGSCGTSKNDNRALCRRAAPPAAAHGALPSLAGICRVDDHPHGVLLILRSSPTEDDLRAIQQALRGDAAAHGDEAVRSKLCDAYERGYQDGQKWPDSYSLHADKDKVADELIAAMRAQGDGESR